MTSDVAYQTIDPALLEADFEGLELDMDALKAEAKIREAAQDERRVGKRFRIIAGLLMLFGPLTFFVNRAYYLFPQEQFLLFYTGALSVWYLIDYKIFSKPLRTIVSVVLALFCIAFSFGCETGGQFLPVISTLPLSTMLVAWTGNRFFREQLDKREDDNEGRTLFFIAFVLSLLIMFFVFRPLILWLT